MLDVDQDSSLLRIDGGHTATLPTTTPGAMVTVVEDMLGSSGIGWSSCRERSGPLLPRLVSECSIADRRRLTKFC
jgi:hypothetical protein